MNRIGEEGCLCTPSLIPYISKMILEIKMYPQTQVIAGGGIQNMETLNFYKGMGGIKGNSKEN